MHACVLLIFQILVVLGKAEQIPFDMSWFMSTSWSVLNLHYVITILPKRSVYAHVHAYHIA